MAWLRFSPNSQTLVEILILLCRYDAGRPRLGVVVCPCEIRSRTVGAPSRCDSRSEESGRPFWLACSSAHWAYPRTQPEGACHRVMLQGRATVYCIQRARQNMHDHPFGPWFPIADVTKRKQQSEIV